MTIIIIVSIIITIIIYISVGRAPPPAQLRLRSGVGGGNGCTGDKFGVEPPELAEMIAQVIRDEAFESRAREPPAEPR